MIQNMSNLTPNTAWVFDVDGVITNPKEKKITQEGLIEEIAKRVDDGDIVTLNTGRSVSWVEERALNPLLEAIHDKTKLSDLFIVGEKGATWAFFQNGKLITQIDKTCSLPASLREDLRNLITKEFSDCMFYDESKLTLISLEMKDGYEIADYTQRQLVLVKRLREILDQPEYKNLNLRIDPSVIAVDIQAPATGKHMGARRIENWLNEKHIQPLKIIMVGDSQADTEMAEELQHGKYSVEFVFVGDQSKLDTSKLKNKPTFTKNLYEAGTLEFFTNLANTQ
jgi:hydroxymethylpyrimidine pyrophosphatase-like HAD family hydrolase